MRDTPADVVVDRLFRAIEGGDIDTVADVFSPDIAVWQSGGARDNDRERSLAIVNWFITATQNRRYEVLDRHLFDGGLVQQHVLHGTAHTGATIAVRVGIVIKVDEHGLITRIDEYFDRADLAPLLS